MLDYDQVDYREVVKDCERLTKEFPHLGTYVIETSPSGKEDHWHAKFPKSIFETFEEAFSVAVQSLADKDWLALCKEYRCFGLQTEETSRLNKEREKREKQKVVNKPRRLITSPYTLDLIPATALDARRLVKICEAISDATWEYTSFTLAYPLEQHVLIGCIDEAQANRRMKWLSDQTLSFAATIQKNNGGERQ